MNEPDWGPKRERGYDSSGRKKNAEEKRDAILNAARHLFRQKGFEATTIDAIAEAASVSAPTVYAAFSSKRGVLKAILNKARFNAEYEAIVSQVKESTDVIERLSFVAAIVRSVYEGERQEMDFLKGSGIVDPEFAAVQNEQEIQRRDRQKMNIDLLAEKGMLRDGLDVQTARDLLWTLTSRDVYHMLAVESGWGPARYQSWLAVILVEQLTNKR